MAVETIDFLEIAMTVIIVIAAVGIPTLILGYVLKYKGTLISLIVWSLMAYALWIGTIVEDYEAVASLVSFEPVLRMVCFGALVGTGVLLGLELWPKPQFGLLWLFAFVALGIGFFLYLAPELAGWVYEYHVSW
jgi:hypothetical protein